MSKHSKNNTNSTVFTYQERQKLKGQYGTHATRIGQDSIKTFKMCTICNNSLIEPMACLDGHVFCKPCVIQFLVKSKKKQAEHQEELQKQEKKLQNAKREEEMQKEVKRLQQFEKYDNFMQITGREKLVTEDPTKKKIQQSVITTQQVKPVGIYELNPKKDQYVKTAFWSLQNTPATIDKVEKDVPKITKCPGGDHKLTLKKLRPLLIKSIQKEYYCWICGKEIQRQKVGAYKCGHVVCNSCKSNRCEMCEQAQGWIPLENGASSFAAHQKAQVQTYSHAFVG